MNRPLQVLILAAFAAGAVWLLFLVRGEDESGADPRAEAAARTDTERVRATLEAPPSVESAAPEDESEASGIETRRAPVLSRHRLEFELFLPPGTAAEDFTVSVREAEPDDVWVPGHEFTPLFGVDIGGELRSGERPWIPLPPREEWGGELARPGVPWSITVGPAGADDPAGRPLEHLWAGNAVAYAEREIAAGLVRIEMRPMGALTLRVVGEDGELLLNAMSRVSRKDRGWGEPKWMNFVASTFDLPGSRGDLTEHNCRALVWAGEWELSVQAPPYRSRRETITVPAGAELEHVVAMERVGGAGSFRGRIAIPAPAHESLMLRVEPLTDSESGSMLFDVGDAQPDPNRSGYVSVDFDSGELSRGAYRLSVSNGLRPWPVPTDPSSITASPPADGLELEVLPSARSVPRTIVASNALTGDPVEVLDVWVRTDGEVSLFRGEGSFDWPLGIGADWAAAPDGFAPVFGDDNDFDFDTESQTPRLVATVELHPGWGRRFTAWGQYRPDDPGDRVAHLTLVFDGRHRFQTDGNGEVWVTLDAVPETVEVDHPRWMVLDRRTSRLRGGGLERRLLVVPRTD